MNAPATTPTPPAAAAPPGAQLDTTNGVRSSLGAAAPEKGQAAEKSGAPAQPNLAVPGDAPTTSGAQRSEWRKPGGLIISLVVIVGAVVLTLQVWNVMEHHP